ncbi:MAG: hypothetical protein SH850_22600 [Planctomycetaceae bacterium]|nr:hypothetical protein [Planctomycetaceae bacterium]
MNRQLMTAMGCCGVMLAAWSVTAFAQQPPYDVFPTAEPPYYRVRYEASTQPGELIFPVNYTIWIPPNIKSVRGVIVHQHGCGEGSCKSGLTGAYDLHWQALAKKHDCALLSPSYEQPEKADCQMWCDPRNGSADAFRQCLVDLGAKSGHPELATVPWALWGHSGGGHWAGGMVMLFPERVAAAWLRSGVPLLRQDPERSTIKAHALPEAALKTPMMCNLGAKEGVTVKDGRFAGVWPANEAFFGEVRAKGGLISVAVDPLTAHECGNQRYFAIPWLHACLSARLPDSSADPLKEMPTNTAWLSAITGTEAVPAAKFDGDPLNAAWLPDESMARAWMQYVKDTLVADNTPPPAPTDLRLNGSELSWDAEADLESGLAHFMIERDGRFLANVPEQGRNPFGRPVFQNLQYSDTPTQPLVPFRYTDTQAESGKEHTYRMMAVNTAGLKSNPSANSVKEQAGRSDAAWINGPPVRDDFFPIAVWVQQPANAPKYKAAGINLYVGLWNGPTDEQLAELTKHGMPVVCAQNFVGLKHKDDPIIVGWMHGDEPGNAQCLGRNKGYGPPILPAKIVEDYQRLKERDPSRPILLNLGQGVAWDGWYGRGVRTNHPEDYAEYVQGADIVSFDIYPGCHTHADVAGKLWFVPEGVSRLRRWSEDRKPVWTCIECTRIDNVKAKATPHEVRAEVWMALIRGARGLIYFSHQFQPKFIEAGLLADPEMLASVTATNQQIQQLARVLNAPTVGEGVAATTTDPDVPVEAIVKRHDGATYVFAVAMRPGQTAAEFRVAGMSGRARVDVLGEDRRLDVEDGTFRDTFAPWDVHLYRLAEGGSKQ